MSLAPVLWLIHVWGAPPVGRWRDTLEQGTWKPISMKLSSQYLFFANKDQPASFVRCLCSCSSLFRQLHVCSRFTAVSSGAANRQDTRWARLARQTDGPILGVLARQTDGHSIGGAVLRQGWALARQISMKFQRWRGF